jgi:hypothetical protein
MLPRATRQLGPGWKVPVKIAEPFQGTRATTVLAHLGHRSHAEDRCKNVFAPAIKNFPAEGAAIK